MPRHRRLAIAEMSVTKAPWHTFANDYCGRDHQVPLGSHLSCSGDDLSLPQQEAAPSRWALLSLSFTIILYYNKVDLQSARLWLPGSELAGLGPALLLSCVHHQAGRVKCLSGENFIWLISAPGTKILLPYQVLGRFLAPILQRKWAQRLCLRVASPARGKCYNNPPSELPLLNHNRFTFNIFFQNSRRSFATKRNIYPDEFSKKNTRWAKISQQC